MTDERTSGGVDPNSVRKVMSVKAPAEIAWRVFTESMGTWWPLANFKIGKAKAIDAVIEPRVGGRWYERGEDGSTCQWGSVLAREPPSRLLLYGTSTPTGSMTLSSRRNWSCASSRRGRTPRGSSWSIVGSTATGTP